jgi:hypothetical protein
MKTCVIRQPAGLGDIFFCQKIAKKIQDQGYEIIWPVIPEFLWIKNYIDGIVFCDINEQRPFEYDIIFSLEDADKLFPNISVMEAKYKLADLRWDNWCDHFKFNRNVDGKEDALFYDVLKLTDNSKYALKNSHFASPPHEQICEAARQANVNGLQEICMSNIVGFTLLDWSKVIERAQTIHTVETSINYIIEKVNTTNDLHMYSKWNPANFFHIKNLFKKPWKYYE